LSYIGKTPTPAPLTSSDITDGIITTTKIADANVTNPKLTSGSQQNFRNIIINGDMSIAQRSTSVTGITGQGYNTVDRYATFLTTLGTWTQSQSTDVPTGQGFATSLKMDCTTADASPAAGDRLLIQQKIEGQNLQYIKKGTSDAESLTVSFWVKSNKTGTYIAELFDNDNTRQISKSYSISSANTWEKKTMTFAGDTSGTLGNDNGDSLILHLWLGAGTTYSSGTLSTTWTSNTNANRAVGQVNLADSTSNEFYLTGVQLEAGTTASDFEFLPFDVNRQRCYRYYRTLVPLNTENTGFSMGFYTANNNGRFAMHLENPMRTTPTLDIVTGTDYFKIFTAGGGDDELNSFSIMANSTERFVIANNTSQASGTGGQAGYVQSSSNSAYLGLEAEL
jgi:hypothetical protein